MKIGALLGPVTASAPHNFLAEQARCYAGEGFSSLWSAQALGRGQMITDPLLALAVAATVTERVELGTAILQLPLYHPMDLAHRVFSLQQLCGDRLILGVGAGSTAEDFAALGKDYGGRFRAFNAKLAQLRDVFATGEQGDSSLSPWPSVLGGPPLYFGTWGAGVERAAREFDGWIASGAYREVDEVVAASQRYHAAGGGRSLVSTILINAATDLGQLKENFQRYARAGFDDVVVMLLPGAPEPGVVAKLVA